MQPNLFATLALSLYPLLVIYFFATRRPPLATALSFLVAETVLPPSYALPLSFPTWLTKAAITPIAVVVPAFIFGRKYMRGAAPFRGVESFFLLMLVGAYFTMDNNRDPLSYGPVVIVGEKFGDFTSDVVRSIVDPWLAFFLGRVMFKSSRDLQALTIMLVGTAAIYTIPILIEVRMSPQINYWLYGYVPFGFQQEIRWGGYRPAVLFGHGLLLAFFMLTCCLAATALARARKRVANISGVWVCLYLLVVLILCKSTGAIVYALFFVPIVAIAPTKWAQRLAAALTIFFVIYPILRLSGLIPTDKISAFFSQFTTDRAQSLSFRFDMEQGLIDMTVRRPWFGWGGYARNFVYDASSGKALTVVDGMVIQTLSSRGIFGFYTFFIPFAAAVLRASWLTGKIKARTPRVLMAALTLCGAVTLFDLIVNSTFTPLYVMLLGALAGLGPGIVAEEARAAVESKAAATGAT